MNSHFTKEDMQTAEKHTRRCSTAIVARKMHICISKGHIGSSVVKELEIRKGCRKHNEEAIDVELVKVSGCLNKMVAVEIGGEWQIREIFRNKIKRP